MAIVNTITLSSLFVGLMLVYTDLRYIPILIILSLATLILFSDLKVSADLENVALFLLGIIILFVGMLVRGSFTDWIYIIGMIWTFIIYEKIATKRIHVGLLIVLATLQFISLFSVGDYQYDRFTSFLYHPNSVGQVAVMLLSVVLIFSNSRLIVAIFASLTILIAVISASRQAFLFIAMYLLSWIIFRYQKGSILLLLIVTFVTIYSSIFILDNGGTSGVPKLLIQVSEAITTTDGRSLLDPNGRDVLAQEAIASAQKVFWGKGYNSGEYEYDPTHNMFLDILYRGGWPYFAWYLVFLVSIINKAEKTSVKAILVAVNTMVFFDNAVPFGWSPDSAMTVLPFYLGCMANSHNVKDQDLHHEREVQICRKPKSYI